MFNIKCPYKIPLKNFIHMRNGFLCVPVYISATITLNKHYCYCFNVSCMYCLFQNNAVVALCLAALDYFYEKQILIITMIML
jgi:hypothetical protein